MQLQTEKANDAAEKAKEKEFRDRGDVMECSLCFDPTPIYKVIHCNSEKAAHVTCFDCINEQARSCIGDQKWELLCPDTSGCSASFGLSEKQRAIDAKTLNTLDRIQQQAELLQANLENLSRCPFCDFAVICPPIEIDWELRCENPECEKISCRRCNKITHAPKTCKEAREDQGLDERHAIEEARTAAVIKKCICGRPIVKLEGCNKVRCFCNRTICDYCGKDITEGGYNHFAGEGGFQNRVAGKCPLYDDNIQRNDKNAKAAGDAAKKKIREDNPDISEADLEIKFKENVGSSQPGAFPGVGFAARAGIPLGRLAPPFPGAGFAPMVPHYVPQPPAVPFNNRGVPPVPNAYGAPQFPMGYVQGQPPARQPNAGRAGYVLPWLQERLDNNNGQRPRREPVHDIPQIAGRNGGHARRHSEELRPVAPLSNRQPIHLPGISREDNDIGRGRRHQEDQKREYTLPRRR